MKSLVLLSGGVDSTVALFEAARRGTVVALSVAYGQKHAEREHLAAAELAEIAGAAKHLTVDISSTVQRLCTSALLSGGGAIPETSPGDPTQATTVVPFRNPILISLAAAIAQSHGLGAVVFAAHVGDSTTYPDCRPEFVRSMAEAVRWGTDGTAILLAPFLGFRKSDIVRQGVSLRVPLERTYSCYNGRPLHCGRCGACQSRRLAFKEADVVDATIYRNDLTAKEAE